MRKELENRPEVERDIVVVGLGKEIAVDAWLEEWKSRVWEVIDLRLHRKDIYRYFP